MVFVKTLHRTLFLEVAANEDVLSIKQKIEAAEGIPAEEQRLCYAGSFRFTQNLEKRFPDTRRVALRTDPAVHILDFYLLRTSARG